MDHRRHCCGDHNGDDGDNTGKDDDDDENVGL